MPWFRGSGAANPESKVLQCWGKAARGRHCLRPMTATATSAPTLKFFYNGIKANGGKLQKAHFSKGNLAAWAREKYGYDEHTITIYARGYVGFSAEVRELFTVENDTDTMTDYFDEDKIRVKKDHPLYAQVLGAYEAQEARRVRMAERRLVA